MKFRSHYVKAEKIHSHTLSIPNKNSTLSGLKVRRFFLQTLCKCMKTIEPPTGLCLCADDVSNPLTNWWGHLLNRHVYGPTMSDELYQTMIAR